jgi:hypothetical protein
MKVKFNCSDRELRPFVGLEPDSSAASALIAQRDAACHDVARYVAARRSGESHRSRSGRSRSTPAYLHYTAGSSRWRRVERSLSVRIVLTCVSIHAQASAAFRAKHDEFAANVHLVP